MLHFGGVRELVVCGIYLCEMLLMGFLTEELWMIIDGLTRFYMDGGQKGLGLVLSNFARLERHSPFKEPYNISLNQ